MGDAVIALTTNMAARKGQRIEFKKEWFDIHSDETPENVPPERSCEFVVHDPRRVRQTHHHNRSDAFHAPNEASYVS